MFCGSCGAKIADGLKFCENCGAPVTAAPIPPIEQGEQSALPAEQPTTPVEQPAAPADQPTTPVEQPAASADQPTTPAEQPAASAAPGFVAEVPADSAWEAQPQQAYQVDQTTQMPTQPGQSPFFASDGAPQPPSYQMPPQNRAPNSAFVLVIVGLVLSALFVSFLPGLVCSIIGLVLNAGYNKKGLDNPRKTSTMVVGIIGVVVGVLSLVLSIFIIVGTIQVMNEVERQGIDITADGISVSTDSSGNINISTKDSSSSAAVSGTITTGSSTSASSAASASSTSAATALVYDNAQFHDAEYNPTVYAAVELTGSELQDLLDSYNYKWDKTMSAWVASDGSQFGVYNTSGLIGKEEIEALPQGAAGQPVAYALTVEGYSTPTEAFNALTNDVVTEDMYGSDDVFFAVVYGPSMTRHLVAVTSTDTKEQTFLMFTEESIADGVFEGIVGVNAGSTMDAVWQAITGGYHIGGYVSK